MLHDNVGNNTADFLTPPGSALKSRYLYATQVGRGEYSLPWFEGRAISGLALAILDVRLGKQLREGSAEAVDVLMQGSGRSSYRVARVILEGNG